MPGSRSSSAALARFRSSGRVSRASRAGGGAGRLRSRGAGRARPRRVAGPLSATAFAKSRNGARRSAVRAPMPRTRVRSSALTNGPPRNRSATMRSARARDTRGSRWSSSAGAVFGSSVSPAPSGCRRLRSVRSRLSLAAASAAGSSGWAVAWTRSARPAALAAAARASDERDEGQGAGFVGGERHRWNRSTRAAASGTRAVHQDRRGRGARGNGAVRQRKGSMGRRGRDGPTPVPHQRPMPGMVPVAKRNWP